MKPGNKKMRTQENQRTGKSEHRKIKTKENSEKKKNHKNN